MRDKMTDKILTRMGDGERVALPASEVKDDIAAGIRDAAQNADIPELTDDEADHLFEIVAEPSRSVSVARGEEIIVTDDGCSMSFYAGQDSSGIGVPLSRMQAILTYERACAADTVSMGHSDYSFKPVKSIIDFEMNEYYTTSMMTTVPFFYGAQPNMGLYFQPDGPHPNPADLLPKAMIPEARQAQEAAAEQLRNDLTYVGKRLDSVGCEGLNFDTCGSAGDADLLAALQAVSDLKKATPQMPVIMGGSGEFVLGMHGEITFDGRKLAGLYPHDQAKVAESAGASIYGVAININTGKSSAYNIARAVTFVKAAVAAVDIPVHVNVGMGVGGVPMMEAPPIDTVTRASKSLVQIGKADGL
jgi:dimethylamine--corrinoid protein Co-methyltransferase